jgi:Spx/MgsR family transcriptional regulator
MTAALYGITLYGIRNCDTVKKARAWLERHGIEYRFHDFRVDGLSETLARQWIDELGIDVVVNKRGTTWRQLDDTTRATLNAENAPALLVEKPALIKRPVLDIGHQRCVGFDEKSWQDIFRKHTL